MVCHGYRQPFQVPSGWQQRVALDTLGHCLDDDAGISSCFKKTSASMLRCFYSNLSTGLQRASGPAKFCFLRSCVQSVAQFRWSRWPFQRSYAGRLDASKRKMLAGLLRITPHDGEPYAAFVQRRHLQSGRLATQCGRFSHAWAESLKAWNDHVTRRHDTGTWSLALLVWKDQAWLIERRVSHSSSNFWKGEFRSCTRAYRGHVHNRKHD